MFAAVVDVFPGGNKKKSQDGMKLNYIWLKKLLC